MEDKNESDSENENETGNEGSDLLSRESWSKRLKRDIQIFHAKTGMKYSTIGMKAIGNGRFWTRLNDGGDITVRKADELYSWMNAQGFNFNS